MQNVQIVRAILAGTFIVAGIVAGAGAASATTTHQSAPAAVTVSPDTREGAITDASPGGAPVVAPDGTRIWW
ncbi:hypothetical protein SAMN04489727_1932 [Amycolatopsis tolypomycina]|uniref:Uncharacterized protein n=1 Tax=Amycolatopsis tolypomycina TaxID=208445 RepID=A0A1H4JIC7_9PSEU|nr:hypothetical protein [Amycolatopsis tolypomycina]SEB46074.1 hypothetical protein SAMN04489727_1932 [Amycolatopsis tolypomycina]